jgi:hypothetical protein
MGLGLGRRFSPIHFLKTRRKSSPRPSPKEREVKYEGFWWGLMVEFWGLLRVGGSSVNYGTAINGVLYTIYKEGL